MINQQMERRLRPRFSVNLPVELTMDGQSEAIAGVASNISVSGIYFYVSGEVGDTPEIQFVVTFPPEFTLANSVKVRCHAKVVRFDRSTVRGTGIAAAIQRYEFLERTESAYPFAAMRTRSN
jgi:hypothetical protein